MLAGGGLSCVHAVFIPVLIQTEEPNMTRTGNTLYCHKKDSIAGRMIGVSMSNLFGIQT